MRGANDAVYNPLLLRKLHIFNPRFRIRKINKWPIQERTLHRPSQHSVGQKNVNAGTTLGISGIAEVSLEGLLVETNVCAKEAEVGIESKRVC